MAISRRTAVTGLMTAGVAVGAASCGKSPTEKAASVSSSKVATSTSSFKPPLAVDMPSEMNGLLLNQENAITEMQKAGVDLFISGKPKNVYYLTNQQAVSFSLGLSGLCFATLSAHGNGKPSLIGSQIGYYFTAPEEPLTKLVDLKFYASPADPEAYGKITNVQGIIEAPAGPGLLPRLHEDHTLTSLEAHQRLLTEKEATEMAASSHAALLKEIVSNPLPNKTIAIDDYRLREVIEKSGLDVRVIDGENLIRRIRIKKSPMELELARYAAAANAAAAREAALAVRSGATYQDVRSVYWKECGARATRPVYMMIDSLVPHFTAGEIKDGRSFLIDCVSDFEGYHGDYGRTVCVGEPTRESKAVIDTLSTTWDRLRAELRPGMTYFDIFGRAAELFKESNVDAGFAVNPHTIGLHHSDDPQGGTFGNYQKENLTLVENMILSIDMPVLDNGLGGTAHLEDLVLIGKDGAELLNDTSDRFIIV